MPRCTLCGRRFDSLTALREHHRAMHPASKFVAPKVSVTRGLLVVIIIVLVAVSAGVGYLIYSQYLTPHSSTTSSALLGSQISPALFTNMTSVSTGTMIAVGAQNGANMKPNTISSSTTLFQNGQPEVLYIGAEFCPFCAAERWSLVVALSKFGTWSGLEYMLSAPSDGNISTVTFVSASYSSQYIAFVPVEDEDRAQQPLQTPTSSEEALWNQYNSGYFPFIDIGGRYDLTTSQFNYNDLSGLNWSQIASQLNNPNSQVAKDIVGGANYLISAICKITNGSPASVCGQSFAQLLSLTGNGITNSNLLLAMQTSTVARISKP